MHTFILGNPWAAAVQVSYLRHSHVGEAATSNVELSKGWPIINLKKFLNLFSLPRPMKSSLEMGSSLKDRPAGAGVPANRVRVFLNQAGECLCCEADTLWGAAVPDSTPWSWPGWVILPWQPTHNNITVGTTMPLFTQMPFQHGFWM